MTALESKTLFQRWHIDLPLLISIFLLLGFAMIVLYSAGGQNFSILQRQGTHILISMILMFSIAQIPPRYFLFSAPWLYIGGVILLLIVLIAGDTSKGATRWLGAGSLRFQPAELMKIAVPLMLAFLCQDKILPLSKSDVIKCLIVIMIPFLLIIKQPDLGTALLILFCGFSVLFLAGVSYRFFIGLLGCVCISAPILWAFLHDYQKQRILTFLNPENDPLGSGYHIIQSKIALGSGGLFGKGWLNGTQSHLDYLPERTTDFIFSALGEEFGFIGILLLFSLYLLTIMRSFTIGIQSQHAFCRLLVGGLAMNFFITIVVNVGMVSGLLPVVGLPLPLMSYGGTALVTLMIAFGMLMSIQTHRTFLGQSGALP